MTFEFRVIAYSRKTGAEYEFFLPAFSFRNVIDKFFNALGDRYRIARVVMAK